MSIVVLRSIYLYVCTLFHNKPPASLKRESGTLVKKKKCLFVCQKQSAMKKL